MSYFVLSFGLMLILVSIRRIVPVPKMVYKGVISEIDHDSQLITVEYEKNGEMHQGTFCFPSSSRILNIDFRGHAGMEVIIGLGRNGRIQLYRLLMNKMSKKMRYHGACFLLDY